MAIATAKELSVDLLIVSEPNIAAIRGRKDWVYGEDFKTAIIIFNKNIQVRSQGYGHGFTFIMATNFIMFSCYCSGNDDIEDLEMTLQEIEQLISVNRSEAIIAGDFNAKSPQWGMHFTDARGQLITEWMSANSYVLINQGDKPTFVHQDYGSILDLTMSTEGIQPYITKWEVLDIESLSDHNYIMYGITQGKQLLNRTPYSHGWQVKRLNVDKLIKTLHNLDESQPPTSADDFSEELKQICDTVMPKKTKGARRQPVYWWNDEIAELRKDCLKKRREYTRKVRNASLRDGQILWEAYKTTKLALKNKIKSSKRQCWEKICAEVDSDIWGDGYKIVMKGLSGFPPRLALPMDIMENVVNHLFPVHGAVHFICDNRDKFTQFTSEELEKAANKLKNRKAPGPGNIPPEVIKMLASQKPHYTLSVYNTLAEQYTFPAQWKKAKIVLLRKGDKPLDNPSSFRPICLLDAEGKLYEQLLRERLNAELIRTGGLSPNQFGFRKGRQTVDAINKIIDIAQDATDRHSLCATITLDVRNAFNSASWQHILETLRSRGISESLISIISSYLSDREILLEAEGNTSAVKISSGVPQGSVLGPTLWNILYDPLIAMEMPEGVTLVGFADDVAVVVTARNESLLMSLACRALQRVANWMESRKLRLAPEKTEAVLLTKRRKIMPISFELLGSTIEVGKAVKYLGVWLDTKLSFAEHIKQTIVKAEKTVTALASLMPNIGGPKASKRRVLSGVVHSQILYGSPAWYKATQNKKLMRKLLSTQRKMALRICSAYRTVSTEGVGVIAGLPPIDLMILERRERYTGITKEEAKENLLQRWQIKWDSGVYGRWTHRLIPVIRDWIERPYGETDYFLTQALSGHGCFRKYLYSRNRGDDPSCPYCNQEDDAEHTLFVCPRWNDTRTTFSNVAGIPFETTTMMISLLGGEESWNYAYKAIRTIIQAKELESRR